MVPIIEYQKAVVERQLRASTDWFYWIPALSVLNTVAFIAGIRLHFFFSLGVTSYIEAMSASGARAERGAILILVALAAAVFGLLGYLAKRGSKWALSVGMTFYILDIIFLVLLQNYLMIVFHLVALYFMYPGLQACSNRDILVDREIEHMLVSGPTRPGVWPPPPTVQP